MKKILFFGILMLFLGFGQAFGALTNITATEDLYYSGTTITNANGENLLVGRMDNGVINTALLQFRIPANSIITSAELYLYKTDGQDGGGVNAYYALDAWNEASIAVPSGTVTTALLGTNRTNGGQFNGSYLSWDLGLTPGMISDGLLSVALTENPLGSNVRYHVFNSSEASVNRPFLRLTYTTVPVPTSVYLLGAGLLGLVGLRRRLTK